MISNPVLELKLHNEGITRLLAGRPNDTQEVAHSSQAPVPEERRLVSVYRHGARSDPTHRRLINGGHVVVTYFFGGLGQSAQGPPPSGRGKEGDANMFVMKCGGSTLAALPDVFFEDLTRLQAEGEIPVIVHGGGPAISDTLGKLGIETEFVNGLRKTNEAVLDVVEMVLAGQINKQIVRNIQRSGANAVGLSGVDGHLIQAQPVANAHEVGLVGDVTRVNAELIQGIVGMGYMPVIAPVGIGADGGQRYNINADTAAGAVASHLGVERMIVVTDVPGILKTVDGEKRVLPSVTVREIDEMIASGDIYGGMIPKVRAAVQCIQGEVREVVIVNGSEPQVLSKVLKGEGIGTRIVKA